MDATPTPDPSDPSAPPDPSSGLDPRAPSGDDGGDEALRCVPVDLRDYVRFSEETATRVRVLWTPHLALDLWCIEPMQATEVLRDPDRDITYTVVGGRSWFVTDQGEIGLDPLGALLVPAGVVHGIDNRAPDPLIVVASSAPPTTERPAAPTSTEALAIREGDGAPGPLGRAWRAVLGRSAG